MNSSLATEVYLCIFPLQFAHDEDKYWEVVLKPVLFLFFRPSQCEAIRSGRRSTATPSRGSWASSTDCRCPSTRTPGGFSKRWQSECMVDKATLSGFKITILSLFTNEIIASSLYTCSNKTNTFSTFPRFFQYWEDNKQCIKNLFSFNEKPKGEIVCLLMQNNF